MKKSNLKILCLIFVLLGSISSVSAQNSRAYIRDAINEWGECKNVAITKTNGDLALYGRNGWAASDCPSNLVKEVRELHDTDKVIEDVQLTENGSWLILYGGNGMTWDNIPYSLEKKIREYNNNKEVITAVTFNDLGDWIVITTEHFSSSHENVSDWLADGLEKYGPLWTACVNDDGCVAVYERGYKFLGDVPQALKDALNEVKFDVYRLKFAGGSWFIADKNGNYRYSM